MALRPLLLPLAFTVAALPVEAYAKCVTPPVELLWSYPADGDVDVPTNAVFWSLNKYWYASPTLTLNGAPVATTPREPNAASAPGTPLGTLEPQRDYVLRLEFPQVMLADGGTAQPLEIAFRTGDGPVERLLPVRATGHQQTPDGPDYRLAFLDAECSEEIRAQGCFDTGPNRLIHFDVEQPRAVGFVVGGTIWPARCGQPALYKRYRPVPSTGGAQACFDVQAIGPGGLLTEATQYCVVADATMPVDASSKQDRAESATAADGDGTAPPARGASSADACTVHPGDHGARGAVALLIALVGVLGLRRRSNRTG